MSSEESSLGIRKIYSLEFVVDFFERSREFYTHKMGFVESHRSTPEWETRFNSQGVYFASNDIKMLVTSPLASHSYTAEFLKILSPGIRKVTFQVENLDRAAEVLRRNDATFIHSEQKIRSGNTRHRFITIATPIGFLEFTFLEIEGDESEIPLFETVGEVSAGSSPFKQIDHLTINSRTIYPIYNFFEHVMGFRKFWSVSFHTPDLPDGAKGTGLSSQVMWDPASKVKFASNEPLCPHYNQSQIQAFVNLNHGAGIQHVAFSVDNIIDEVRTLRSRGIKFLDTPETYYDLLPKRLEEQHIESVQENLSDLRKERILLDGKNGKYLLQIFLKDASLLYQEDTAGPFFYEVIQRRGHPGFGEGNFRALFEAIALQETSSETPEI